MSPAGGKVQAVIAARLARLSAPARELAGVAATIGRDFSAPVLADASDVGEQAFVRGLDELWRRGIVRAQGLDAYDFSHGRIREAAYEALSPAQRRHHHLRAAHALERAQGADLDAASGLIAAHHEAAGAADEAVRWYSYAADAAQRLHDHDGAARALERALALCRDLPPSGARDERELAILTALPGPLVRPRRLPLGAPRERARARPRPRRRARRSSPTPRSCARWRSPPSPAATSTPPRPSASGCARPASAPATTSCGSRAPGSWASPPTGTGSSTPRGRTSRQRSSAGGPSTARSTCCATGGPRAHLHDPPGAYPVAARPRRGCGANAGRGVGAGRGQRALAEPVARERVRGDARARPARRRAPARARRGPDRKRGRAGRAPRRGAGRLRRRARRPHRRRVSSASVEPSTPASRRRPVRTVCSSASWSRRARSAGTRERAWPPPTAHWRRPPRRSRGPPRSTGSVARSWRPSALRPRRSRPSCGAPPRRRSARERWRSRNG